jgi:hypothetical protein
MLKLLLSCLLLTCQTNFTVEAAPQIKNAPLNIKCAPQLQDNLNTMLKLPEIRDLISTIQKEGNIQITVRNTELSEQFGAFWDMDNRIICIAMSPNSSKGRIIGSILFELHNALANSQLNALDELAAQKKITKSAYVEGVERIEYHNSLKASAITAKGVKLGLFPPDAELSTYSSFEEHYRIQQWAGHSAWIAKTYDDIVRHAT